MAGDRVNWTCPFCAHKVTIGSSDRDHRLVKLEFNPDPVLGDVALVVLAVRCPNEECRQVYLKIDFSTAKLGPGGWKIGEKVHDWQLLPESSAKPQPDYIPDVIREDYYEACRIRDLSSKASATLSRRCLQGMIRDFWKVKPGRLVDEIDAIEDKVDPLTWEAINGVRHLGNIGAHMEKDVNVIVDVDPDEAQLLIELIELLFGQWYVTRHNNEDRARKVIALKAAKEAERAEAKQTGQEALPPPTGSATT